MELTSENVRQTISNCLFKTPEEAVNPKIVQGIRAVYGFNPVALNAHKEDIYTMLCQLPEEFINEEKFGGSSFLNACVDKNGDLWTSEHAIVDDLLCLGLGIDKIQFCLDRIHWGHLPGGMPYFLVKEK